MSAMEAGEIGPVRAADVGEISRIHCAVLPEGFLAQLGPVALSHIYSAAFAAPGAIGLVARNGREIGGFLLATADTRQLFRHVLLRRTLALVPPLVRAVLGNPRALLNIFESLRYPARRAPGAQTDAELVSIGVLPEHRSRGFGRALIEALNREFAKRGVPSYTVSVYAVNAQARAFYEGLGFAFVREFEMYDRAWTLYRARIPSAAPR